MAKSSWKELLPCKECYNLVKNKELFNLQDRVEIKIYDQEVNSIDLEATEPYYTFNLTLASLKRPYSQRNRELLPLLSEKSLARCENKLLKNTRDFYFSLWLNSSRTQPSNHIVRSVSYNSFSTEDKVQWWIEKKKEFKSYYQNLSHTSIYHKKGCYVDFYLSPDDPIGLIARIKRRWKLKFYQDSCTQGKIYLAKGDKTPSNCIIQLVTVKFFVVSIFSGDKLAIRLFGDVFLQINNEEISLDNLSEQGIELYTYPDWRTYG